MEHKKIELKPCPLCGGYARFEIFSLADDGRINVINDERENAARDWNRRNDNGLQEN